MSVLNPIDNPQIYDRIILGKTPSPGYVEVTGWKREYTWDKKIGKGTKGGTRTMVGVPLPSGTFKFFLWLPEHWDQWAEFRKLFKYDPTKKTITAIDVYYPTLADIEVKSIVCEDIGAAEKEELGKWSITVTAGEYNPASGKSAVGTPTGSTVGKGGSGASGAGASGTVADPIADAQQKEIAALLAEAQKP